VRTKPLTLIAIGVVLVAVDFRIVAFDALPDVVGWLLVAAAAWRLTLRPTAGVAVIAAAASAPDLVAPHHWEALDPLTGAVVPSPGPGTAYDERLAFDRLTDLRLGLAIAAMLAGGLVLWWLLGALRDRAQVMGDDESTRRLALLRWLVPLVWVLPYAVVAVVQGSSDEGFDPVWNGGFEPLALVGLAVAAAVAWVLVINNNRAWTVTDGERATPWADMIAKGA
jgi:hypothetical protein